MRRSSASGIRPTFVWICGIAALAVLGSLCGSPGAFGQVNAGQIYIADQDAGPGAKGAILRIDRATGAQSVVSSGGQFEDPTGVAIGPEGQLYVSDSAAAGGGGAVFRVDPATGAQSLISSGGAFQGPRGITAARGVVVVADPQHDPPHAEFGDGDLIDIDPETGAQSSGLANVAFLPDSSKPPLADPSGIALFSPGCGGCSELLVADPNAAAGGSGAVYTIHTCCVRGSPPIVFLVSAGANLVDVFGLTFVPSGFLGEPPSSAAGIVVAADPNAAGGPGAVIALDSVSHGQRVLASAGGFSDPTGVAFLPGPPSELLVADQSAAGGAGAVFAIGTSSGSRSTVSSAGEFVQPTGIAVVPPLCHGRYANNVGSEGADDLRDGGIIVALDGDDSVQGDDNDDLVCGGAGNDRIESTIGVSLTIGNDTFFGEEGKDKLIGAGGGSEGKDKLFGDEGNDKLKGRAGADKLSGGKGRDTLNGGKGIDTLRGGKGTDLCVGGNDDRFSGCEERRRG